MRTVISIAQQHDVDFIQTVLAVSLFLVALVLAGKAIDLVEDWRAQRDAERVRQLKAAVIPFEARRVR